MNILKINNMNCVHSFFYWYIIGTGLENSTRLLVFTSTSDCRASKKFDISKEINFFPYMPINFVMQLGRVPILIHFETCGNGPEV